MQKAYSLFFLVCPLFFLPSWTEINQIHYSLQQYFNQDKVEEYAESITVRVFPENSNNNIGGSGVLVYRTEDQYTIVTNHHVITQADRVKSTFEGDRKQDTVTNNNTYQIQTFDRKIHAAKIIYIPKSDRDNDVAFLTFTSSDRIYPVATLKSDIAIEATTSVIAGGFPFGNDLKQSQTFQVTEGTITEVLERPFIGGYQIGYTNSVLKGMSGGPVLNYNQELIGINGMGQYPLFGNPYTFEDGSTIPDSKWEDFSQLSWAVPIKIIKGIKEKNRF